MSILAWIVVGLIAGFLGSKLVNGHGEGPVLDLVLGVVGAVVGGFLSSMIGLGGVDGINVGSILIATGGAALFLVVYHAIRGSGSRRMV
jgi:uncharacterized membrane protein YeaQ/YmgE (transglycosylase-associated protein family)